MNLGLVVLCNISGCTYLKGIFFIYIFLSNAIGNLLYYEMYIVDRYMFDLKKRFGIKQEWRVQFVRRTL
jgi:hypothetical protein